MLFHSHLTQNQVFSHSCLANLFEVKSLKNSRYIKELRTLVLIADYTKEKEPDHWISDVLHLTGTQKIGGATYSKLADSRVNGVNIHLFQVMTPGEYVYSGRFQLATDPYTQIKPNNQLVWVYPIQPDHDEYVKKPDGLVFENEEDFKNRGEQAIRHFVRHRDHYIGYQVRHVEHGLGVVNAFDGKLITVTFGNNDTRDYNFKIAFQGGYLKFVD